MFSCLSKLPIFCFLRKDLSFFLKAFLFLSLLLSFSPFSWAEEAFIFDSNLGLEKSIYGNSTDAIPQRIESYSVQQLRSKYRMGAGLGFIGDMGLLGTILEVKLKFVAFFIYGFKFRAFLSNFPIGMEASLLG